MKEKSKVMLPGASPREETATLTLRDNPGQ
jgi:hypothetical protein